MNFSMLLLTLAFCLLNANASAGESGTEVEIDPIAYALSGYSIHLGRFSGAWKFDINAASESLNKSETKTFLSNTDFTTRFVTYGAKVDYIGASHFGFHVGLQWDYIQWRYTSTVSNTSVNNNVQDAGVRVGYRWGAGSLYVDPWVGFLYNYQGVGNIGVGGQNYVQRNFQIFPTLHVGFRF